MLHARPDYQIAIQDNRPESEGGIPANEPVFLLRAKDLVAPIIVRTWALIAYKNGADETIYNAAIAQAALMDEWQRKHGCKIPDMPEIYNNPLLKRSWLMATFYKIKLFFGGKT